MDCEQEIAQLLPREAISGRRGEARFTFNAYQRIAACAPEKVPTQEDFGIVRCYDLSRKGFSYLVPQPPAYDFIVTELTLPKGRVYLRARVAHITGITVNKTYQFQVGCEFIARVTFPAGATEPAWA